MIDPGALFRPTKNEVDDTATLAAAMRCIETFTECFNARDLAGMDASFHFPHVILSAEKLVVWVGPGQLPASFLEDRIASTGWHRTTDQAKRAVLVSPRKVHIVV